MKVVSNGAGHYTVYHGGLAVNVFRFQRKWIAAHRNDIGAWVTETARTKASAVSAAERILRAEIKKRG